MGSILPKIKELKDPAEIKDHLKRPEKDNSMILETVSAIVEGIKKGGDIALIGFIKKYDGFKDAGAENIRVRKDEITSAAGRIRKNEPGLVDALEASRNNIQDYHSAQYENFEGSWMKEIAAGKEVGQKVTPVGRVGLYIPGGRYVYPSTLLMAAIPAITAGVKEVVVFSPPGKDGKLNDVLLYLCRELGIEEIYRAGGAQAVAAMALGTESVKKVDMIAGPGNAFVTMAKKMVFGTVGIDSLAGPSDVTIIADRSASPELIAIDMLSQSEHDPLSRSILLCDNEDTARESAESISKMLGSFKERKEYMKNLEAMLSSVRDFCKIFYCSSMDIIIDAANNIAPEHLEIMVRDPAYVLERIQNAGAIFIGDDTPVAVGDYIGGTNHIIPTEGNARFASPLGVADFLKRSSICRYSREALEAEGGHIAEIAGFEGLYVHRDSIMKRFDENRTKE